ncbi:DoxX family membrane protein [Mucilaginibacter ginsenosidivorans]|uniref:DoxX family membrane protein n=1 Tax=Mucilaginibacter ginsenosidivorans TaxID=398053 RepID=A0A5B8UVN7_9SPHI|nr:DoxX family membrane protein [Mucilaginibacter ginsenosidivorans]QEC62948.1 DoxX family membrane protein [Mucilaginibacter ginsenosidivorans]
MKTAVLIARLALGLIYLVFGLDYFLNFMSHIINFPPAGEKADAFFGALGATGYFFPFLKTIEIICAVFLLINRYTAFFAVVLFPITMNIFMLYACLAHPYIPLGTGMLVLNIFMLFSYRKNYSDLLSATPKI